MHYNYSAHMQRDLLWMWSHLQSLSKHLTAQVYCIWFADKLGGPLKIHDGRAAVQQDLDRLGSKRKGTLWNSAGQSSAQEGRALGVVQLALLSQGAGLLKKNPNGLGRQKHDLGTRGAQEHPQLYYYEQRSAD